MCEYLFGQCASGLDFTTPECASACSFAMLEVELVSYILQSDSGHFYRQSLGSVYKGCFVLNSSIWFFQNNYRYITILNCLSTFM